MPSSSVPSSGHHVVDVDGIQQSFHVAGEGPVVVVHPGGPGMNWQYLQMPLLENRFTMVYLEPIGTGGSGRLPTHPHGYTVQRFAKQIGGFLDALDLSQVVLLGHSHGGYVVQEYAIEHPNRVSALILYATSAVTGREFMGAAAQGIQDFASRHQNDPVSTMVLEAWQSVPRMASDDDYTTIMRNLLPAYFADESRKTLDLDTFRAGLSASILVGDNDPFDSRSKLPDLTLPVLILAGDHDFICGPIWAETLSKNLPSSESIRFGQSGHFAHMEQPEGFLEAITSFVARHEIAAV